MFGFLLPKVQATASGFLMVAVRTVKEITSVDYNSSNVIYLITCNGYSLQYVGKFKC